MTFAQRRNRLTTHFSECNSSLSDARLYYDSIISIRIKEKIRKKVLREILGT